MAAAIEKSGSSVLLGRNIFRSPHTFMSPMAQLKISPHSSLNISDLPSPDSEKDDPNDITTRARFLARDYINYKTKSRSPSEPRYKAASTLRCVGDELVDRHQTVFNAMARRLEYSNISENEQCAGITLNHRKFLMIAQEVSKDGKENWGRIVTLFVLGSLLALNNMENEGGEDIDNIITFVGDYVGTQKKSWIEKNGGWAGFIKFFDDGSTEERKVWKGLLCAFGIGGAIASFAVRQ